MRQNETQNPHTQTHGFVLNVQQVASLLAHMSTSHLEILIGVSAVYLEKLWYISCLLSQSRTGLTILLLLPRKPVSFFSFFLEQRSVILSRLGRLMMSQVICSRAPLIEQMVERGVHVLNLQCCNWRAENKGRQSSSGPKNQFYHGALAEANSKRSGIISSFCDRLLSCTTRASAPVQLREAHVTHV